MESKIDLLELDKGELAALMREWGQPVYRADQIWRWIHRDLTFTFDQMTNLPGHLREMLSERARVLLGRPLEELVSQDGETRKVLLELSDGETIESVLMLYERRRTACISTQVGCPIGCAFCATGRGGLRRDLTAGEIIFQALYVARMALPLTPDDERPLTNIVYMGMGEPLLNYDATWSSIRALTDGTGFGLGARHITISTAGVIPGILRMAEEPQQVGLAISLHAPTDALRDRLVPLNRRYPLGELMAAIRTYVNATGRRVTFEYALIEDINDAPQLAEAMADLIAGLPAHVNLIPVNPAPGMCFEPPPRQRVDRFVDVLERRGVPTTVRLRRGIDVSAGCGQLRSRRLGQGC